MSYVEIETGRYVKRWAFWNPATWSIPKLYWDAWSMEQRTHAICRQLEKVIKYADYLGMNVDDIAARLKAIEDGQLDDFIVAAIEEWFEENEPQLLQNVQDLQAALPISEFDSENTVKDALDEIDGVIDGINDIIGDGFTSENTVADAISSEETARQIADGELSTAIENLEKTIPIPNSIECMEPVMRVEMEHGTIWQGGTRFEYQGNEYFAVAEIPYDAFLSVADKKLSIYDENGIQTASINAPDIGHGETITYMDGKIYVANGVAFYVYDVTPTSIVFNSVLGIPNESVVFAATLDEENYYFATSTSIRIRSRATGNIVADVSFIELGINEVTNGIFIWPEFNALVFNNHPETQTFQLKMLDLETYDVKACINTYPNYGYIKMHELEWFAVDGYELYIGVNGGYNHLSTGSAVSDIAPQTVMKTNVLANNGYSAFGRDLTTLFGLDDTKQISLDYTNGAMIPDLRDFKFKYAQDLEGFMRCFGQENYFIVDIDSNYPGVVSLQNTNCRINIDYACGGFVISGGHVRFATSSSNFTSNSSAWLLEAGIYASYCIAFLNIPGTPATKKICTSLQSIIICTDSIWSNQVTKYSSTHLQISS